MTSKQATAAQTMATMATSRSDLLFVPVALPVLPESVGAFVATCGVGVASAGGVSVRSGVGLADDGDPVEGAALDGAADGAAVDGAAVGGLVGAQVGAQVGGRVGAQVGSLVGTQVGAQVGGRVGAQVGGLVGTQVGAQVGG
eukprot:CAMPEP_0206303954 /NCGR_PEP_ID=MMETSP0106_2-20121207/9499_1 /ASSEMBLY_ACC=CAM_ASM_000206 /TAXON_ID=81532 /ORGANISM="Acanthoeca-like sp., Strain 10tr" /LENGTH=141 /DNA_ID=CAMNT_0053734757 /DNA_START=512 /DNA_END=933 /DNA_ORIENTATION=+